MVGVVEDPERWANADWSYWDEYRVLCANGETRHRADRPSVRGLALDIVKRYDRHECGPHTIEQRGCARGTTGWGSLLSTDAQSATKDAILRDAQRVACPKCSVGVEEPCVNLTSLRRGVTEPTAWPHSERLDLVMGGVGGTCPYAEMDWFCTRPRGHTGAHVGEGQA